MNHCFLGNHSANDIRQEPGTATYFVDCKFCGAYQISHPAILTLQHSKMDIWKASAYIKRRNLCSGNLVTILTSEDESHPNSLSIEQMEMAIPDEIEERIILALLNLIKMTKEYGDNINLQVWDYPSLVTSYAKVTTMLSELCAEKYIQGYMGVVPLSIYVTGLGRKRAKEWIAFEQRGKIGVLPNSEMRMRFLIKVNELSNGSSLQSVSPSEISIALGLTYEDALSISTCLQEDGFLKFLTLDGDVLLTSKGRLAVERDSLDPLSHEAPSITYTINNTNSPGAQVGIQSIQHMNIQPTTIPIQELLGFIERMQQAIKELSLDDDDRDAAQLDLQILQKQISNPKPDAIKIKTRVKTFLGNLGEKVTVQAIASQFPKVIDWIQDII